MTERVGRGGAKADAGLEQPGLRQRMKSEVRRVSSQHRQLEDFFEMLSSALARDSLEGARIAFQRFRDALDAHLTLEDTVFFPALNGLSPGHADELSRLVEEHALFREELETLHDCIARGRKQRFSEDVHALAERVWQHEQLEEELLARLTSKQPSEPI